MSEIIALGATFLAVLVFCLIIFSTIFSRRKISKRLTENDSVKAIKIEDIEVGISGLPISESELLKNYFNVIRNDDNPNSTAIRLIRAGYFSSSAVWIFQLIRFIIGVILFFAAFLLMPIFFPEVPQFTTIIAGFLAAGISFVLCNIMIERRGDKKQRGYRKIFPDFMDTLIVCLDAGLSLEASLNRVMKEFLSTANRDFGLQLAVMMLEVRGGRRLRDSLNNFAIRLAIDEAKSLAVLFRQSEELGASVTKSLRVFSQELRDKRIIKAEEKANTLPLKMLFPISVFLFPMSLLIVLVPIVLTVLRTISALASG